MDRIAIDLDQFSRPLSNSQADVNEASYPPIQASHREHILQSMQTQQPATLRRPSHTDQVAFPHVRPSVGHTRRYSQNASPISPMCSWSEDLTMNIGKDDETQNMSHHQHKTIHASAESPSFHALCDPRSQSLSSTQSTSLAGFKPARRSLASLTAAVTASKTSPKSPCPPEPDVLSTDFRTSSRDGARGSRYRNDIGSGGGGGHRVIKDDDASIQYEEKDDTQDVLPCSLSAHDTQMLWNTCTAIPALLPMYQAITTLAELLRRVLKQQALFDQVAMKLENMPDCFDTEDVNWVRTSSVDISNKQQHVLQDYAQFVKRCHDILELAQKSAQRQEYLESDECTAMLTMSTTLLHQLTQKQQQLISKINAAAQDLYVPCANLYNRYAKLVGMSLLEPSMTQEMIDRVYSWYKTHYLDSTQE